MINNPELQRYLNTLTPDQRAAALEFQRLRMQVAGRAKKHYSKAELARRTARLKKAVRWPKKRTLKKVG